MGAFSSDNSIEAVRFSEQGKRCALCGKGIVLENSDKGDRGAWHAHHIDGNSENNNLSNCACVCINEPQNCHLNIAHSGDYSSDYVAPPKWFRLNGWNYNDLKRISEFTVPLHILWFHLNYD